MTPLGQRVEEESGNPRTMVELGAGKAKMELERVHCRADGMEEPGGVHKPRSPQRNKGHDEPRQKR